MRIEDFLYLSSILISVICAIIFLWQLQRSFSRLPNDWQLSVKLKRFRLGAILLFLYLTVHLIFESIACWMSTEHINNHFLVNINSTISIAILFIFFYIHTQTIWMRYIYVLLYLIMVGYFTSKGLYYPGTITAEIGMFLSFGIYFIAALFQLSDLLLKRNGDYWAFQLKICVVMIVTSLLATITGTYISTLERHIMPLLYTHLSLVASFYLGMAVIFISETRKLRRG